MEVVYFVQAEGGGPIKIGVTRLCLHRRLGCMQTGNPERLVILGVIAGGRPVESEVHARFARHRLGGEWFRPAADLLRYVAEETGDYDEAVTRREIARVNAVAMYRRGLREKAGL